MYAPWTHTFAVRSSDQWLPKDPSILKTDSEDSDKIAWMPRR